MAIIAIFLGGTVGFIAATISMIGYDASLLSAIGVYFTTGLMFTTGAIANVAMNVHTLKHTPTATWKPGIASK